MANHKIENYIVNDVTYKTIHVKQKNIEVSFLNYGATILYIKIPDKNGKMESVLIGYKNKESYIDNKIFLNATIGPTSGRIQNGEFKIDNQLHTLNTGTLPFNLHGEEEALSFRIFDYEIIEKKNETKVAFSILKPKQNSNYPGNINIKVIYTIKENELEIEYQGITDEDTILNLTNHSYFNLSGNLKRNCLNQEIFINASRYLDLVNLIPTSIKDVQNTNLDFRQSKPLSVFLENDARGIDHPFLLDEELYNQIQASLYDPVSKRLMNIYTTYPSIVCYSHNHPDNQELNFNAKKQKHLGICFETQLPPNSMHIQNLTNQILRKNEAYNHKTRFEFSIK